MLQEYPESLNPVMSIGKQFTELLCQNMILSEKEARQRVLALLGEMGFSDTGLIYKSYPHQLSGGMKQRAVLALALIVKPRLLILDEPTTSVDQKTKEQVLKIIKEQMKKSDMAVLVISHDSFVINELATKVIAL